MATSELNEEEIAKHGQGWRMVVTKVISWIGENSLGGRLPWRHSQAKIFQGGMIKG